MTARIHLDRPHAHFTNLDFITGKVIVQLHSDTAISGIQVKLEGESRTRLAGPRYSDRPDKKKTELEVHKLLYKVATVFPTPEIFPPGSNAVYTLAAGYYEYPFQFKFPFNNSCSNQNSMLTNLNVAGFKVEVARDTDRHVKKTLPPSFSGFPGMAEIRYYVKATIIRPEFYKENIRAFADLTFLPIEPPRTGNPNEETYARRQQQFSKHVAASPKKSLFHKIPTPSFLDTGGEPPRISVDARLPHPPILTCNEPLPLRILVKKLTPSSETIFLQSLQIELIAYTHIRAHDLTRKESGSWVILSHSNMNMILGRGDDPEGTEWKIDATMWNRIPLPNTVAPSFETCNIARTYELEIRVGLAHGSPGAIKPELLMLPLRHTVRVYSGIAPPQALLDAMGFSGPQTQYARPASPPSPGQPPPIPPRPAVAPVPVYEGIYEGQVYDDAPPSYEDAIAEELGPVDGPRREYNPPDVPADGRTSGTDVKSPVGSGKDSERLFPNSGPSNHSTESLDMLPSTPSDSRPSTACVTPAPQRGEAHPTPAERKSDEQPSQYQPTPQDQLQTPEQTEQTTQRRPSRPDIRTINLGVPKRKPVPGSPNSKHPPTS
ncbi:hypothetical protein M432DRAFT_218375 [Thermoascus aurantiacus ATCC 26904]